MNDFAKRLSLLMSQKGVSQTQLAEHLNVKQQTISKYINGIIEPGLDTVLKIAKYFDETTDYLLGADSD
jgi:transcriptional regulator with XRE-family HTH domain